MLKAVFFIYSIVSLNNLNKSLCNIGDVSLKITQHHHCSIFINIIYKVYSVASNITLGAYYKNALHKQY